MINERGRHQWAQDQVHLPADDSSNPKTAVEHTSELVEQERVQPDVRMLHPSNLATPNLSQREKYPAALCRLRRTRKAAPEAVSMEMGWQPTFRPRGGSTPITSGRLSQQEDRRAVAERPVRPRPVPGLQEGLGITANMIVADIAIDADMSSMPRLTS